MDAASACVGDYANDGFPDFFVATSTVHVVFRNEGNGAFTRITGGPLAGSVAIFPTRYLRSERDRDVSV